MKEITLALFTGWLIGIVFSWMKLPLPVPPFLGIMGIIGMYLGGVFFQWVRQFFQK